MGIFWTLSGIKDAAVVEYGCMGHNLYGSGLLRQTGTFEGKGASIYTTYIDETDIAMGDGHRLEDTIRQVIASEHPQVILLQPSAVPEVVGTDLVAIANVMQEEFDVPLVPIGHGSFAISQHKGVQDALCDLVSKLTIDCEPGAKPLFNIVGSCPDLFHFGEDMLELKRMMKGAFGMESRCVLSSDCTVEDIRRMGEAQINLVFRREGIPAAEWLKKKFGTPYVYGRPYGIQGTTDWLRQVGEAMGREPDAAFIEAEESLLRLQIERPWRTLKNNHWSYPDEAVISLGGHADVVAGILKFAMEEIPMDKGDVWCDCPEHATAEIPYLDENGWMPIVKNHKKGYLMASGEQLLWAGKNTSLQIANPDIGYRVHPYGAPFVGYHGAAELINLWVNEYVLTH